VELSLQGLLWCGKMLSPSKISQAFNFSYVRKNPFQVQNTTRLFNTSCQLYEHGNQNKEMRSKNAISASGSRQLERNALFL
jgi:hypothetical protein